MFNEKDYLQEKLDEFCKFQEIKTKYVVIEAEDLEVYLTLLHKLEELGTFMGDVANGRNNKDV